MTETERHTLVLIGQLSTACSMFVSAVDDRDEQATRYRLADVVLALAALISSLESE